MQNSLGQMYQMYHFSYYLGGLYRQVQLSEADDHRSLASGRYIEVQTVPAHEIIKWHRIMLAMCEYHMIAW